MKKRRNQLRQQKPAEPVTAVSNIAQSTADMLEFVTGGSTSAAGVTLNERTAMTISAVYSCIQLIAGAVASLPLPIFERTPEGNKTYDDPVTWRLLNVEAHAIVGAATFWEYIITSKLMHGDGFARIIRRSRWSPDVVALEPLHPLAVQVLRVGNRLNYYLMQTGEMLDQDDMLHFSSIGFEIPAFINNDTVIYGYRSISPLRYALKYAGGIALAADKFSADFFGEGSKPEFVIKMDSAKMDASQRSLLQDAWRDMMAGNRFRPGILSGGMTLQELTLNAEETQLIETRNFQVEDVCRIYGVPPFMVGHTANTSSWGTGVEAMGIGFVKYTLSRHLVKIEQELNRKLFQLTPNVFCEFVTAGLERGDTKGRFDAYRVALGRAGEPGFMTVNEVRKRENMAPITGGDELNKGTQNAPTPEPSGA